MAAPAPRNFLAEDDEGFPDDLVVSILQRVPCKGDRASMSRVSNAWRRRIGGQAPPPAPLPWLLLPSRFRNNDDDDDPAFFRAACVLSGCCVTPEACVHAHHSRLTIPPPAAARFVGSYDGAWIFLYSDDDDGTPTHWLFNARTRQARMLPGVLARVGVGVGEGRKPLYSMVMLVATLSSSPDDPKCVGATIVARERDQAPGEFLQHPFNRWIAFWRMGWPLAYLLDMHGDPALCLAEDVVYHDGAFHFLLTRGGAYQILVCTPDTNTRATLAINAVVRCFLPPGERVHGQNATVRARYLVVSRGELLMVVRLTTGANNQQTSSFKVFRATERPLPDDGDGIADFPVAQHPWEWSEMDTLDGRILFVGYGCSRSYETYQADEEDKYLYHYPGFEPGIYFLDDGVFYEALMVGDASARPYPCSDNGMWCQGRIQADCFPTPNSSDYSPPVWLLP